MKLSTENSWMQPCQSELHCYGHHWDEEPFIRAAFYYGYGRLTVEDLNDARAEMPHLIMVSLIDFNED